MKWKTKEFVSHKDGELRVKPVFAWWPRNARVDDGDLFGGKKETRWMSFNLLQQRYYPGELYDTENIFGAKTVGLMPSFWGSDAWIDSKKLTINERVIALRDASWKAVLFLGIVGIFAYWMGYSGYAIYDSTQRLRQLRVEQQQHQEEAKQRIEESLEKLNSIIGN